MAKSRSPRRRSAKAVDVLHDGHAGHAGRKRSPAATLTRAAVSKPAKFAYIAVGAAGLAALAVAILGPKRLRREVFEPLRDAVGPQAEKLWEQAGPARDQLAGLFHKAGDQREKLVRDVQSWIGHFRAS